MEGVWHEGTSKGLLTTCTKRRSVNKPPKKPLTMAVNESADLQSSLSAISQPFSTLLHIDPAVTQLRITNPRQTSEKYPTHLTFDSNKGVGKHTV
jgi:hypothetical protein